MSLHRCVHRLRVVADADPTLLGRVCGIAGTLSLVPDSLHATLDSAGREVSLTIVLSTALDCQLDLLIRKLSQITLVHTVDVEVLEAGSSGDCEPSRRTSSRDPCRRPAPD